MNKKSSLNFITFNISNPKNISPLQFATPYAIYRWHLQTRTDDYFELGPSGIASADPVKSCKHHPILSQQNAKDDVNEWMVKQSKFLAGNTIWQ